MLWQLPRCFCASDAWVTRTPFSSGEHSARVLVCVCVCAWMVACVGRCALNSADLEMHQLHPPPTPTLPAAATQLRELARLRAPRSGREPLACWPGPKVEHPAGAVATLVFGGQQVGCSKSSLPFRSNVSRFWLFHGFHSLRLCAQDSAAPA